MSDLKLFRTAADTVTELAGGAVALERSLQLLFEKNLEALLGVRFLASELVCEGGRMDTIGIDENGSPVIIEYKRATNENVIDQGSSTSTGLRAVARILSGELTGLGGRV